MTNFSCPVSVNHSKGSTLTANPIPEFFDSTSSDLQLAAAASSAAGKIIRAGYGHLHEVEAKGIGDLVSEIDRNADEAAAKILNSVEAPLPILSEEAGTRINWQYGRILDRRSSRRNQCVPL